MEPGRTEIREEIQVRGMMIILKAHLDLTKDDVKKSVSEYIDNPPDALVNEVIGRMQDVARVWAQEYLMDITPEDINDIIIDLRERRVKGVK